MALINITNDLFDIAARLKAVDDDYRVMYNAAAARFEVHSASRGTMQLALPFDELDARTVDYVLQTRIANADRIFAEVERHNAELEQKELKSAAKAAQELLSRTVKHKKGE